MGCSDDGGKMRGLGTLRPSPPGPRANEGPDWSWGNAACLKFSNAFNIIGNFEIMCSKMTEVER